MFMANAYDGAGAAELDADARALNERREAVLGPTYRLFYRKPVALERGLGVWLYDSTGQRYLDAYNNVPVIGHSHPLVQRLVNDQLGRLNTHTRYLTESVVRYSERLLALFSSDLSKVVYTCTGSEAVDLALRTARYETGAQGIICTSHAYHGVTAAAAEISPSLGANNLIPPHVVIVDAPDFYRESPLEAGEAFVERVRAAIDTLRARGVGFAGMIVDSVLSSDGVQCDPATFLRPAAEVVQGAGGLWIADEVQSGFGRLGTGWWGFDRHGIEPDLVVLGKPMGNGLPIAALVGREQVMAKFGRDIRYFNTFGGNPVSIAAATAVLDVIEEDLLIDNARDSGAYLTAGLQELSQRHPSLGDVRGAGLFVAVEIVGDDKAPDPEAAASIVDGLRQRHVLISASGRDQNVLKIRPPLPFDATHADILLAELDASLSDTEHHMERKNS
ncbi:aspartate aminotransferase family protein [Rhodococcus fascians]|nr:aspartate aminotransferase family protein [Rhodococcus fascians]MBY4140900.1 aspartate aminotransferase family protein [Rhodococcus fascians]MBY4219564.1 aspartate aminotransferase family protein [Rhodococcus fascians]MBY4221873.1 aspartate aminotransferase family protein [Rhodococcus fascians]MBY4233874.1 aspartate aminotransferase family protein [Rhodococcus fascians]